MGCRHVQESINKMDKLCCPTIAGGLNFLDVSTWNKVIICKMLWNLCRKKDKLWVQWIHSYYKKDGPIWNERATQASWVVRKILKAKETYTNVGYMEDDVQYMQQFSTKVIYNKLRGEFPKVKWRRFICNNQGSHRWIFILYLALNNRQLTRDRLAQWKQLGDLRCMLCQAALEIIEHLFFECTVSAAIWNMILHWQGLARQPMTWQVEKEWTIKQGKGKTAEAHIYRWRWQQLYMLYG
ncbi:uncharacterized protein [Nicotiana tomentosiformis]|uniref:uncharacterized protein n=1 Tax=Nicotiana tomentosiformis TaxID=4098 RepID=UPI00388C93AC